MSTLEKKPSSIVTSDGVRLNYVRTGPSSGRQIIFIAGWRQTAAQWQKQVDYFGTDNQVITYDHRGHGDSDKPQFGYRIYRLAADLYEIINQLDLQEVHLVAHSMGCCVTWAFWDLYATMHKRISKIVLVDQSPCMTINPAWSEEEAAGYGATLTPQTVYDLTNNMHVSTLGLVEAMVTAGVSEDDRKWILEKNFLISDEHAAALLRDHASMDWRDVLPRMNVPSLVIAAEASLFPAVGVQQIAKQIPGAKLETFTKDENGSHFMFWENPKKFNSVVETFFSA